MDAEQVESCLEIIRHSKQLKNTMALERTMLNRNAREYE